MGSGLIVAAAVAGGFGPALAAPLLAGVVLIALGSRRCSPNSAGRCARPTW